MRDLFIFAVVFGMLPLCFARPFFGLLVWSWLGYMNPHKLTWGIAYDFPFVQLAALCTLTGMLVTFIRQRSLPNTHLQREGILLVMLCAMFVITTFFALRPDLAWLELGKITKIMVMTFVTIMLVDDEKKLRQLLLVIALSIGFFGFKGGIFSLATGGTHVIYGPMNSSLADNTAIAVGMNMVLPMLYYLAKSEPLRWFRRFLYLMFYLTIIAVPFTYSRGGMLGLAVVLGMIALGLDFRKKIAVFVLILLVIPFAIQQVPDQLIDRAETIGNYEEDGSAQARFGAWRTAWMLARARPLVGGGFQIIDDKTIGRRYNPDFGAGQGGVHSIYFEVLAENGFVTLGIFLSLLLSTIMSARKIRKTAVRAGFDDFYCYGYMLEIGIFAYAVTGAFLEFASFDLYYQLVAITIVAKMLLKQKLASLQEETTNTVSASEVQPQRA
jgi:probable O-glycosylation ligase (exosortase A-associated)